jgi:hypothetical protein
MKYFLVFCFLHFMSLQLANKGRKKEIRKKE